MSKYYQKYTEKGLVNRNLEELDEKSLITFYRSLIERQESRMEKNMNQTVYVQAKLNKSTLFTTTNCLSISVAKHYNDR